MTNWFTIERRVQSLDEALVIVENYERLEVNYAARVVPRRVGWRVEARKVRFA
jgi:hypothetical protein